MSRSLRRGFLTASLRCAVLLSAAFLSGTAFAQISPGELSEAHSELEGMRNCLACHSPQQAISPERCLACHTALGARIEAGKGLHADAAFVRCELCHIEHYGRSFELTYWGKEGRDGFDHSATGWPLAGAHREVGCRECHQAELLADSEELASGAADPRSTFLGLGTTCVTCHEDPHRSQLGRDACLDCHNQQAWSPAPGFDHDQTSFPLLGEHRALACTACHDNGVGGDPLAFASCADCHEDPHQGRANNTCASCHDPAGWLRITPVEFDHGRTRFPLLGEHRTVACEACHNPARPAGRQLAFASCADCHADPHQGRLGNACASCHDSAGWLNVDHAGFDHDLTRFPLRGEHGALACAECHVSGRALDPLAFGTCAACHGDPHVGQLDESKACASCHTVHGFEPSTFTAEDHRGDPFALVGSHLAVACVDCHGRVTPETLPVVARALPGHALPAEVVQFRFPGTACADCHQDPHDGETEAVAEACADCHSLEGWSAITFDHEAATGFALDGGHALVACIDCHPSVGSEADFGRLRFEATPVACAGCHPDPHFGTAPREATVACADCHTVEAWLSTTFDHLRDAGFELDGAHARLICADCHEVSQPAGRPAELPTVPPNTCEGCHGVESLLVRASRGDTR